MELETAGLGTVIEAIFGGMQFSGASVSLQQVLSEFEDLRSELLSLDIWFMDTVCRLLRMPEVMLEHKKFRMGEDLQYLQLLAALQSAKLVSIRRLHEAAGIDSESERQEIMGDQRFLEQLRDVQMRTDSAAQEDMMMRQMTAQAEGQVAGLEAQIEARTELMDKILKDPEQYRLVLTDPQLRSMVFGAESPPIRANETQSPVGMDVGSGEPSVTLDDVRSYLSEPPDNMSADDMEQQALEGTPPPYHPPT